MKVLNQTLSEKIEERRHLYLQKIYKKKILLIGWSRETHIIAENLNKISDKYAVVGCMRTNSRDPVTVLPKTTLPIFGDLSEMEVFLHLIPLKVSVIIVVDPDVRHHQMLRILHQARKYNVELWTIPQLSNVFIGNLKFFHFYGHPVIKIKDNNIPRRKLFIKTILDYLAAICGLILTWPILLLTAILIKWTSPGPVFFKQERVGQNGRAFKVIKFRSMFVDAEKGCGPILCLLNDMRITPLGRILRKIHIDELPQFFNILNGTMSIVGPRPERPALVEKYIQHIPFYNDRFVIKPGITGMAQVYGAYHSNAEEKLIFDLNYIHNFSLWLDLKICFTTVFEAFLNLVFASRK